MKLSLLLLFGGESSEHEISLISARNIYRALDKQKYDITLGYISRDGSDWRQVASFEDLSGPIMLPVLGKKIFRTPDSELTFDVVFPVLHGQHGEDGDVQGLARLMHIPCVGPSLIGAAITMDKDVTKRLVHAAEIPVVAWITWYVEGPAITYADAVAILGETMFIKPANAGSSVGVSKVRNETEFTHALKTAAEHGSIVLIEQAVSAREIEIAVLGASTQPIISEPGEVIPGEEFYSYNDKYAEDSTSSTRIPADLSDEVVDRIKAYAKLAYIATRGQGMARIDFFVDETDMIYLNEINSIPGFTDISMYPKLMEHTGKSYPQLLDELIQLAVET